MGAVSNKLIKAGYTAQQSDSPEARSYSPEAIERIVSKGRDTRIRNLLSKAETKGLTAIERKWLRTLQGKTT